MHALVRHLETDYPRLGKIHALSPLTVDVVSSRIFLVQAEAGTFVLKQPLYQRRHGSTLADAMEDWALIGDVRDRLAALGVPVEEALPRVGGGWLGHYGDAPCWVCTYYGPRRFQGEPAELAAAGAGLGTFHAKGREILKNDPSLAALVRERLRRDLPLTESLRGLTNMRATICDADFYLRHPKAEEFRDVFDEVRACFVDDIPDWARDAGAALAKRNGAEESLCHHDYHPANVLFPAERPLVILDLEQMGIGPTGRGLAMAVTRFALAASPERTPERLRHNARLFLRGYRDGGGDPATADLPTQIRMLELEKTLRILGRFLGGESFPAMLRKLATHHLWLCRHAEFFDGL